MKTPPNKFAVFVPIPVNYVPEPTRVNPVKKTIS